MVDCHPNTMRISLPSPKSMPATNSMSRITKLNAAILHASHSRAVGVTVLRSSSNTWRTYRPTVRKTLVCGWVFSANENLLETEKKPCGAEKQSKENQQYA